MGGGCTNQIFEGNFPKARTIPFKIMPGLLDSDSNTMLRIQIEHHEVPGRLSKFAGSNTVEQCTTINRSRHPPLTERPLVKSCFGVHAVLLALRLRARSHSCADHPLPQLTLSHFHLYCHLFFITRTLPYALPHPPPG